MLKTLNKRENLILLATGALIIFGFCFKIILDPLLVKNEVLNNKIKIARTKLKKDLLLLNQKEYWQGAYAKISSEANPQQESEDSSTNILVKIEKLAKNSNVRIVDIRPQTQKNLSSDKENYVELRIEGDMESCLRFIYNIENSLALFQIRRFQLNAKPASSNLDGNLLISQISL